MKNDKSEWTRHPDRSNAFDGAILASYRRAWHPLRDLEQTHDEPFDLTAQPLLPESYIVALETRYIAEHLTDPAARVGFINDSVHIYLSDILHGERAALAHAARLCLSLEDLGAQENAASQAREEARHVTAFSLYINRLWGKALPPTPVFAKVLSDIASSGNPLREVAGMQVLVEGLAMGIFAHLEDGLRDPLGRQLIRNVMDDEAAHLKGGAIMMDQARQGVSAEQTSDVERWTARQFLKLSRGLFAPTQQPDLYARYGLDPQAVAQELRESGAGRLRREAPAMALFRTVAKAVQRAGLIGTETQAVYQVFLEPTSSV